MAQTFINERHRKYSEDCRKIIEETSKRHYSAEQVMERCRRNLGLSAKKGTAPKK